MNIDTGIILTVIGVLVFLTNVIVEVVKQVFGVSGSKNINKIALCTAMVLTIASYFMYIGYSESAFIWYYFLSSVIIGFVIALIAMVGWDKVISLWKAANNRGQ